MTTEIVIDRHGLINKVDFVRALAVRHLAESRKFHPDATEEHRKWREMKNACKQLAAAYLKTLRTAADANMYLDQLHLIMYENSMYPMSLYFLYINNFCSRECCLTFSSITLF